MTHTVDIQAGIPLGGLLVAILAYVFRLIVTTSPQKLRARLREYSFTFSSTSVKLQAIEDTDVRGVLPLYYRSVRMVSFVVVALPTISFLSLAYCVFMLAATIEGNLIPRTTYIQTLVFAFLSTLLQGILILFVEKTKLNVDELKI